MILFIRVVSASKRGFDIDFKFFNEFVNDVERLMCISCVFK